MKQMKRIVAAALVGVMVLAGAGIPSLNENKGQVMAAEEIAKSPSLYPVKEVSGDAMEVSLGWSKENLCTFNYAIIYDASKVSITAEWDADFVEEYNAQENSGQQKGGVSAVQVMEHYVVFGGVYTNGNSNEGASYTGNLVKLTITKNPGAEGYGVLKVIKNKENYSENDILAAKPVSTFDLDKDYVKGDPNFDNKVNAADAVLALKHYANLNTLAGDAFKAADVNADGRVNSADAVLMLKRYASLINDAEWEQLGK